MRAAAQDEVMALAEQHRHGMACWPHVDAMIVVLVGDSHAEREELLAKLEAVSDQLRSSRDRIKQYEKQVTELTKYQSIANNDQYTAQVPCTSS